MADARTSTLLRLIQEQKQETFVQPEQATDEDALGILVSHLFQWDGLAIMRTFHSALEDANFHTEAGKVSEWIAAESRA